MLSEHEAQHLLVENNMYLKALKKSNLPVYSLGFKDMSPDLISYHIKDTIYKPVVPTVDQIGFWDRIVEETTSLESPKSHSPQHMHNIYDQHKEKNNTRPYSANNVTKSKKSSSDLFFARPVQRWIDQIERERKKKEDVEYDQTRLRKVSQHFDIVEKGVKYVYDERGYKIPESELLRRKEQEKLRKEEESLRSKSGSRILPVGLIEKTSKYVDNLRQKAEREKKGKGWSPLKFPGTTVPLNQKEEALPQHIIKSWPEYQQMEDGDVMLTIEHCRCCDQHSWATQHSEEQYLEVAQAVQEALRTEAAKYQVRFYSLLKPILKVNALRRSMNFASQGKELTPITLASYDLGQIVDKDNPMRIGALEVQIAVKSSQGTVFQLLHSKLHRGIWPNIPVLVERMHKVFKRNHISLLPEFQEYQNKPKKQQQPKERKSPLDQSYGNFAQFIPNDEEMEGLEPLASVFDNRKIHPDPIIEKEEPPHLKVSTNHPFIQPQAPSSNQQSPHIQVQSKPQSPQYQNVIQERKPSIRQEPTPALNLIHPNQTETKSEPDNQDHTTPEISNPTPQEIPNDSLIRQSIDKPNVTFNDSPTPLDSTINSENVDIPQNELKDLGLKKMSMEERGKALQNLQEMLDEDDINLRSSTTGSDDFWTKLDKSLVKEDFSSPVKGENSLISGQSIAEESED